MPERKPNVPDSRFDVVFKTAIVSLDLKTISPRHHHTLVNILSGRVRGVYFMALITYSNLTLLFSNLTILYFILGYWGWTHWFCQFSSIRLQKNSWKHHISRRNSAKQHREVTAKKYAQMGRKTWQKVVEKWKKIV